MAGLLAWNRASYALMSLFAITILLILYVWQPLVKEYLELFNPAYPVWMQIDWLLVGIFAFMSLMIMAGADLRQDALVAFVGLFGGLVIESWGTQTLLWTYYTDERPPLWIIPAWAIASLAIDRMVRIASRTASGRKGQGVPLALLGLLYGFPGDHAGVHLADVRQAADLDGAAHLPAAHHHTQ